MSRLLPRLFLLCVFFVAPLIYAAPPAPAYSELYEAFKTPDHKLWGEVPLWWWEGQPLTKERMTAELETLAAKGVKSVCPIQRSPGRCDPQSFTDKYWAMLAHANQECARLGMTLWAYDQVGYGHYGWLEKAAARVQDPATHRLEFITIETAEQKLVHLDLPEGILVGARAWPLTDTGVEDAAGSDLASAVKGRALDWTPPNAEKWRVAVMVAVPFQSFYLSAKAADAFIDMLYGKIERTLGAASMGTSFAGVFQDEHPPTPRDIYTAELAQRFAQQCGYPISRAIPALHFDVGPLTPKYRTDYFDVYLNLVEECYWKRVFDWCEARNVLTSHDNWGRNNIYRQSEGYIDYFRSQRWFSAPGYDDAGQHAVTERNYYDAKIASSIARLYGRDRVWNEAFHSSGWGRTTDQTLSWLSAGMAYGANLYDEHGLYYATNASTWEHAAPDPHWRQPYWTYYDTLSDFVARSSYLMSMGLHVVDAAVHYPVVSLLAGETPKQRPPEYNRYMGLSQAIFNAGIDNDIIDDDSILNGEIVAGALRAGGNDYRALVFGPESTVRRAVIEKALALLQAGGTVLFFEEIPQHSTEAGRADPALAALIAECFKTAMKAQPRKELEVAHEGGGCCGFVPVKRERLAALIDAHIDRDFKAEKEDLFVTHRRSQDTDIYLVMNTLAEDNPMKARFRVDAAPEWWDPFTGEKKPVDRFTRENGFSEVAHTLKGNTAHFLVFHKDNAVVASPATPKQPVTRLLPETWTFSTIPTRDNRWGEFHWPPSEDSFGPEIRRFRYAEAGADTAAWMQPDFDDSAWEEVLYSIGPQWIYHVVDTADTQAASKALSMAETLDIGAPGWQALSFSKQIGLAKPVPWGGHSGYPDGHIDREFVSLPEGRKLLFTRIHSPEAQRRGLCVELRNATPRLWVNGQAQPFEDAVGNLPLKAGANTILLDLPNGDHGRLYVQAAPPSISTMAEAAKGMVKPDIAEASWIWAGDTQSCHVRHRFDLAALPEQARLIISAYSGFRVFINGVQLGEEIGPWSNWETPESYTITPLLKTGENVIAVWGQLFAGQNVNKGPEAFQSKGIVAALKMRFADGEERGFVSDGSWKGSLESVEGWEQPGFDDSAWAAARVAGKMGQAPWGNEVVNHVGMVTAPKRPLSVDLESPYLTCFEEAPDIAYDVKPADASRIGWVRFTAPPGLRAVILPTAAKAEVWVDGVPAPVAAGKAVAADPPKGLSKVAIRLEMLPGAYGGAAFVAPIRVELEGGRIKPGHWHDYALPTYSGIGVYTQAITCTAEEAQAAATLDLGEVLVAAEVWVNGKRVGVRLARPFAFDLSGFLTAGENTIEVRVANTIAPHYTTIPSTHLGPLDSGLMGPVGLRFE